MTEVPLKTMEVQARAVEAGESLAKIEELAAVIVVYKMQPSASPSLKSLVEAADFGRPHQVRVRISVVDNTPGGSPPGALPHNIRYRSHPDNPGLAPVYNRAIAEAERDGIKWLLTLDQDTHLPMSFLASMAEFLRKYGSDARVAAIVPRIFDGATPVSPFRFVKGCLPRVAGKYDTGLMKPHASALNSASILRVSALREVGGYDESFPLNNSDTAIFHRLDRAGFRMVLAGNVVVNHELAIMQRPERMTVERYRQLLKNEREFWDLHMNTLARTERLGRLAGRAAKAWFHSEDRRFQRVTLDELRYRLFTRRTTRAGGSERTPVDAGELRRKADPPLREG